MSFSYFSFSSFFFHISLIFLLVLSSLHPLILTFPLFSLTFLKISLLPLFHFSFAGHVFLPSPSPPSPPPSSPHSLFPSISFALTKTHIKFSFSSTKSEKFKPQEVRKKSNKTNFLSHFPPPFAPFSPPSPLPFPLYSVLVALLNSVKTDLRGSNGRIEGKRKGEKKGEGE